MKKLKFCLTPVTRKTKQYVDEECKEGHYDEIREIAYVNYNDGLNAGTVVGLVSTAIATFGAAILTMGIDHFNNKKKEKKIKEKEETAE